MAQKQVTEISCDRCYHSIITDDVQPLALDYDFVNVGLMRPEGEPFEFQLCSDCLKKLKDFVDGKTIKKLPNRE